MLGDIYPMSAAYLSTQIADSDLNTGTHSPLKELFLYETVRGKYLGRVLWFKEGKDIHSLPEEKVLSIESVMLEDLSQRKFYDLLDFAEKQSVNVAHYIGLNILVEYLSVTPDVSDERKNVIEQILQKATKQELYGEKIIPCLADMYLAVIEEGKKEGKDNAKKINDLLREVLQMKSCNSPYLASYVLVHSLFQKQEGNFVQFQLTNKTVLQLPKLQEIKSLFPEDLKKRYDSWSAGLHILSLEDVRKMYTFAKEDPLSSEYRSLREILISARDIVLARLENASFPQTNGVASRTRSYGVFFSDNWAFQHCRDIFSVFRKVMKKSEFVDPLPLEFLLQEGFVKARNVKRIQKDVCLNLSNEITEVSADLSDSFCSELVT